MVNSMVARATSDMLIGPDWAMNIEISDMLNHDPVQAKDIVKGIKRRIRRSKKPKVQFLALSLLEIIVKNCGDIVHMHVAEKDLPHEMVKIAKKKCDYQVKEKILILIDTWQEAFGGSRARYPQYFAAYQELLRAGAVFPPRSERSAPVSTPPQSHPLSSYSQNARNSSLNHEGARSESSVEAEYPTLSLSEIQNARGSMDVLAEMINAIDPGNKESLMQEALVDLVEQCRTYKQRVVHLVNSTVDESLLCQGLALNDDLQRVLAKYESIVSRERDKEEKSTPESITRDLVEVGSPRQLMDTGESSEQANQRSTLEANTSPSAANGTATTPKADPKRDLLIGDLLGGDDCGSLTQNSLALVPVSAPQPSTLVASEQNALVLVDMFSEYPQQGSPYHGVTPNMGSPYEQSGYPQVSSPSWGAQSTQLPKQSSSPSYGAQNGGSLPPPPWEVQATNDTQPFCDPYAPTIQSPRMHSLGLPTAGNEQVVDMYVQPITGSQLAAINQPFQTPMYPQHLQGTQMPSAGPMQPTQMTSVYSQAMYGHQMAGYGYNGYGQQPEDAQYLDQRVYGLSVKDDTALNGNASSQTSMASYLPPMKQQPKGDDKLFGDLVNMAKLKPPPTSAPPPARTGSM